MTRDLFGEVPADEARPGDVSLSLVLHDERPASWLLAESIDRRDAKWAPKSEVKRGEGRDENVWTMPRWLARDRGWL